MGKDELYAAVAQVKERLFADPEVKANWEALTHINSWGTFLSSFTVVFWFAKLIAYHVEYVQKEYNACTEAERIDVAAILFDELVEFKGWMRFLEPIDDKIFKIIISAAVAALNGQFGKGAWYTVIGIGDILLGK
jgi:hypothetical protein